MAGIYRQWSCLQLCQVCQSASSSLPTLFGISASHKFTVSSKRTYRKLLHMTAITLTIATFHILLRPLICSFRLQCFFFFFFFFFFVLECFLLFAKRLTSFMTTYNPCLGLNKAIDCIIEREELTTLVSQQVIHRNIHCEI